MVVMKLSIKKFGAAFVFKTLNSLRIYRLALQIPHPFMIPIAKPKAVLPVNGMPRFVIIVVVAGKNDVAAAWLPPSPPEAVLLLVIVFVTVDKTP